MAGQTVNDIIVGASGKVLVAPVGTTAPVDVATAWAGTWLDVGLINEDGVAFTDSKDMEDYAVWQQMYPARQIITGRSAEISFNMSQWGKDQVKLAFGGGTITPTTGPPAHYLYEPPAPSVVDYRALGVEWVDGSNIYRLIVPRGLVSDEVETKLARTEPGELPITFAVSGSDVVAPWYIRSNHTAFA